MGAAACVALAWQRFLVVQQGSPQGLRDVHGNKTAPNTINTNDAKTKPRPILINDLAQHGYVSFMVFHAHRHDFIFSAEWPRNFCGILYVLRVRRCVDKVTRAHGQAEQQPGVSRRFGWPIRIVHPASLPHPHTRPLRVCISSRH